jgi:hypothetical protein
VETETTTVVGTGDQTYTCADGMDLPKLAADDVFDIFIGIGAHPAQAVNRRKDKASAPIGRQLRNGMTL